MLSGACLAMMYVCHNDVCMPPLAVAISFDVKCCSRREEAYVLLDSNSWPLHSHVAILEFPQCDEHMSCLLGCHGSESFC
jgi:hypothetical protein